jgi:hypothetical protein
VLQTYTLIVQNTTTRTDLGIATSITQLSRSMGATLGTAIFGTIMASGMKSEILKHLPPEALNGLQAEQFSLRDTAFADEDAGKEMLRSANQTTPEGVHASIDSTNGRTDNLLHQTYPDRRIQSANGKSLDASGEASNLTLTTQAFKERLLGQRRKEEHCYGNA